MFEPTLIVNRQVAQAQGLPARQGRSRRRIGILSHSSPGHYYPLTALGRRLQSRGHEVVCFQVADLEPAIQAAGLRFRQIGRKDFPLGTLRARVEEVCKLTGLDARNRRESDDALPGRSGRDPRRGRRFPHR
jgi:hypothetical protein